MADKKSNKNNIDDLKVTVSNLKKWDPVADLRINISKNLNKANQLIFSVAMRLKREQKIVQINKLFLCNIYYFNSGKIQPI
jgi:hypothetical protein